VIRSLRLSSLGPSFLVAAGAIGITAAVVFAAGTLVLPDPAPAPWQQGTLTLPTVDDLSGSQALLVLSGDDEGRYELNQLTVHEWNEDATPQGPLKLSLTFRGGNASLLITASEITADSPAMGGAASATVHVGGASYFGNDGQCTIMLADVDYTVLEPLAAVRDGIPRGVPIPTYAGTVECSSIRELRTDRHVEVSAVFRHQPEE
jgi:hypothetical protein